MITYEKLTCSILGLQGKFPLTYIAGIEKTSIYNEVALFEADHVLYIWKELRFRGITWRSLAEISKETFDRALEGYKRLESSPQGKSRYRNLYFDAVVSGGDYFPLLIDKCVGLDLKTDNKFRQTIEKMLEER
ncbi:MAG: hypothetical protein J6Y53_04095 [Alphaproteobacteria bacterium]|nr:hypothetical protein [Alphaproteobacteria bacterium]